MFCAGRLSFISAVLALTCNACAPEIGDECESDLDCSAQGSRPCDRTQPGGYCTIQGCEPGTCPEESVCVKFRPNIERLAATYCMYRCEDNGDCRSGGGYRCLSGHEFGNPGDAIVNDKNPDAKFCAVKAMYEGDDAADASAARDASANRDASATADSATPDAD